MTETEKKAAELVRPDLKAYVKARQTDIISTLQLTEAVFKINEEIDKAIKATGKKESGDTLELANSVYRLFCMKYQSGTLGELNLMCLNGITGEYGPVYGINITSIGGWAKSFYSDPKRTEAFKDLNSQLTKFQESRVMSPIEINKFMNEKSLEAFRAYRDTKVMEYYYHRFATHIKERLGIKQFVTDPKEQDKIKELALKEYSLYLDEAKGKAFKEGKRDLAKQIDSLLSNLKENRTFLNYITKNSLKHYWDSLINDKKELEL